MKGEAPKANRSKGIKHKTNITQGIPEEICNY